MANRTPFGVGEWYHCYSRGVDKRKTFQSIADYKRFLQLLFLANEEKSSRRSDLKVSDTKLFSLDKGKSLVSIAAYVLMPNHFHILMQEGSEGGIAKFMQRVGIGYSQYFNKRNDRIGNLFVKPFRSKHIDEDAYLKRVLQYIHLNAAELYDPDFKLGRVNNLKQLLKKVEEYPFSSLSDYYGANRPEGIILSQEAKRAFQDDLPDFEKLLQESLEYYEEMNIESKIRG